MNFILDYLQRFIGLILIILLCPIWILLLIIVIIND